MRDLSAFAAWLVGPYVELVAARVRKADTSPAPEQPAPSSLGPRR
jgi:hypothetical protein